ncbi:MAG: flagellar biosynthesis protein FlhB [Rhodospirillales bacterium]|nr:flagellar biosynthesis protein FlhB [Rhodospirillales bacterium]
MSDEDKSSKTEDPTDKRTSEARDKGQVAMSQEINSWASLFGATFALIYIFPWLMDKVLKLAIKFVATPHLVPMDIDHVRFLFVDVGRDLLIALAPVFALFATVGLVAAAAQVGWTFSFQKLELKPGAFSPAKGVKKIIGVRSLVEFGKSIVKFGIIGGVALIVARPYLEDFELMPGFDLMITLKRLQDMAVAIVVVTLAIMTVIAVLDWVYQKWQLKDSLKMSKTEVKDEGKQMDGDPKVKQRIAQIRMERAQHRIIQATMKADVVITNPTHYAVALNYDIDTMVAPKLVGKGVDELALRMREVADEYDVPIVENPPLARAIYAAVEIDQNIPPEQYHAVAEVISYVYRLKGRLPHDGSPLRPPAPFNELDPGEVAPG